MTAAGCLLPERDAHKKPSFILEVTASAVPIMWLFILSSSWFSHEITHNGFLQSDSQAVLIFQMFIICREFFRCS
jgi:hypothetical protein